MAKEFLSNSEIDELLGVLDDDKPGKKVDTKEQMSQDEIDKALGVTERKCRHYDFKRPHKFSNFAMQQISKRFEKSAALQEDILQEHTGIQWTFSSVVCDELTYEEFLRCVKKPIFFASFKDPSSSSQCKFYSVISKNLLYPIFINAKDDLEKEGEQCPQMYGEFILHILLSELIFKALPVNGIQHKINFFSESDFEKGKINANKKDMGLLVTMTVNVKNEEGIIDFFIPHEFFMEFFEPMVEFTEVRTPFARKRLPGNGYVPLGWCEINDENRHLLKSGEVITFAQAIDESVPLVLRENHLMFAEGDVTMVDEDYAVRITKIHADPKDPNVVKHYGDYGLNVLPGNVYACLGEFQIHDEKEVRVGDYIDLNKGTYETVDLVERDSGKVLARGELFADGYLFAVKITEVL